MAHETVCVCGKPARRKYCSRACYDVGRTGITRGPYLSTHQTNICEECQIPFEVGGKDHPKKSTRFCSKSCAGVAYERQTAATVRTLRDTEAAWLAGLFDGEGSLVNVNRSGGGFSLRMTIVNTHRPLLERVATIVGGGTIHDLSRYKTNTRHTTAYVWQCYSENAKYLLRQMLPWLIVKRDKAVAALAGHTWAKDKRWTVDGLTT